MGRVRKARMKRGRISRSQIAAARTDAASIEVKGEPVRGVKLRTVSLFTMFFALACLGAFIAGRPPAAAAGSGRHGELAPNADGAVLRHDDAGSFLRGSRWQRKTGTQKIEKGAGARAPIHFLLADTQQENEHAERV